MKFVPLIFLITTFVFLTPIVFDNAFGHGLGGDVAPAVNYQGKDVTVSTMINPSDLTVGQVDKATVGVKFFDASKNENIPEVTYRVEVWRGDELLARNNFFDKNGDLLVDVKPTTECSQSKPWQCTKYFGEKHPIAGAYYTFGESNPVIQGPVFVKGGLYNIKVDILGAETAKQQLANPLSFDTFVSVAQEQNFVIQTAAAEEVPVTIKTYYDEVENFNYDSSDKSMKFEMPFNWDPSYVDQVQVVHEEVRVPKSFSPYEPGKQFKGFVDGVELDNRVILLDPYSYEDTNIIHFLITKDELKRINEQLSPSHQDSKKMKFELIPQSEIQKNSLEFYLVDTENYERVPTNVVVSWDSRYGAGEEIPFEFAFFDDKGNLIKDVRYGYSLLDKNDNTLKTVSGDDKQNPGIVASEGIDIQRIKIPNQGTFRIDVLVYGTGINYDKTYSGIGSSVIEIGPSLPKSTPPEDTKPKQPSSLSIPNWIKQNAGWWADGQIGDSDFVQGIQFLIKEGIMKIPETAQGEGTGSNQIPNWIKQNAGWWADGQIGDSDFVQGIQFLIKEGIMKIES